MPQIHTVRRFISMLDKLTIKNYRLFSDFTIDSLARVNLIVGTNNSGKSSLLEAIHLLSSESVRSSFLSILNERGEFVSNERFERTHSDGFQISQIFYGRTSKSGSFARICSNGPSLRIYISEDDEKALKTKNHTKSLIFQHKKQGSELDVSVLELEEDDFLDYHLYRQSLRLFPKSNRSKFITTNYLGYNELALLWDKITLTPEEDKVVEALQILEPQVDRISFTSMQSSNSGILLRLTGEKEPVPLGSMGDGMRRILTIAASLVSVTDGTLLVDEIDTGLYYGVLVDMWRLVLETSAKQNVQVFATTHSWDCVKAFQESLVEYKDPNTGCLLRLDKTDHQIHAVSYSSHELDIAIDQGIEVR